MKKIKLSGVILLALWFTLSGVAFGAEKLLDSFEKGLEGWEIPDWALEKDEYAAKKLVVSEDYAEEGKKALKLNVDFTGEKWMGAYLEIQEYFDWTSYGKLSADLYLPESAPLGLTAKIILTVGEDWAWTEMNRGTILEPGKWTTISADLNPGSTDWRRTTVTDAFRKDVRKFGIRIESNRRPVYAGPVYIDNIKLTETAPVETKEVATEEINKEGGE